MAVTCDCNSADIPCSCFNGSCWNDYFLKCCKCCCCCDKATVVYCAGSVYAKPVPCCSGSGMVPLSLTEKHTSENFEYPEFEKLEEEEEAQKICSLPCEPVYVRLVSTCCLTCNGVAITEVKADGYVSGTVEGENCGPFILTINGSMGGAWVPKGGGVGVDLQMLTDCDDCVLCLQFCCGQASELLPCDGSENCIVSCRSGHAVRGGQSMAPNLSPLYKYEKGKFYLNKELLNLRLSQLADKARKHMKTGYKNPKFRPIIKKNRDTKKKWM